jgi:DNA-binding Xre family transcriptional regulator
MRYENSTVKSERVKELLKRAGISIGDFSRSLWGPKSHNAITYFDTRPDVKVSTLVKMAEILDCSVEDILIKSDTNSDIPTINGHHNVVNSSYVNTDVTSLQAEIKALNMVIEEKNQRIEDLKKANELLSNSIELVKQFSHIQDSKEKC